ncbi:hypothetical protein SLEP1_g37747 [Rubroshorea leprosula]|uniref:CCHC-type domain-containing protein n=1 Tax=Rubroshorea leprosula TaxID=152421 RepID=A0AAV5KVP4_9ROSI|nr:hypothetical protein SLEP1_g37747 [Rubroshorea leprosula]
MAKTSTASASGDSSPTSSDITNNPNSTATIINRVARGPISFNLAAFRLKLIPTNYLSWKTQFTSLLAGLWARQDQLLRHALITSVSENIMPYIAAALTAQQAWETLAHLYANRSQTRVITLKEWLQNMRRDGRLVSNYLRSLKAVADKLGTVDRPLTNDDLTVYILNGLGPEFREIAASLRTCDSSLSFDDLHDRLVAHEESLRREEIKLEFAPVSAHYAAFPTHGFSAGASSTSSTTSSGLLPTPSIGRIPQFGQPTRNNRGGPTYNRPNFNNNRRRSNRPNNRPTTMACQLCNNSGHFARNCPFYRMHQQAPIANVATSFIETTMSGFWILGQQTM